MELSIVVMVLSSFKGIVSVIIYSPSRHAKLATYFLLWNTKEDIFLYVGTQTVLVPVDFHYLDKDTMEGNENWNSLVPNILQKIYFCAPQNTDMHTGLGRCEGEYMRV